MATFVTRTMTRRIGWLTFWLAAISVVLGVIGFYRVGESSSLSDLLYRALTIVRLGVHETHGDPFLELGRWTGVLFLFSALVAFLVPRAEFAWRRLRMRRSRRHTVILGDGPAARAFLADASRRETVTLAAGGEHDAYDLVSSSEQRLPLVMGGDPATRGVLEGVAAHDARQALVVTDDDSRNLEITRLLIDSLRHRSTPGALNILMQIEELAIVDGLIEALPRDDRARVRPFSLARLAARALASAHPFVLQGWYGRVADPRWLFIGFDGYAEALLLFGLRMRPPFEGGGLRVTIVTADAHALEVSLARRYPTARHLLDNVRVMSPDDPDCPGTEPPQSDVAEDAVVAGGPAARDPSTQLSQTAVFVFAGSDVEAFRLAKQFRLWTRVAHDWRVPLFVRMDDGGRWRAALRPFAADRRAAEVIEAFGSRAALCTEGGLRDWDEILAERLHAAYVEGFGDLATRQAKAFDNTTGWSGLAEQFREANRRAVDHYRVKLAAMGFDVPPGRPELRKPPVLTPAQRERVARFEHASWSADKYLAGWRYGRPRDDSRLRHDCLTSFEALGEEQRKDIALFDAIGGLIAAQEGSSAQRCILPSRRVGVLLCGAEPDGEAVTTLRDALRGMVKPVSDPMPGRDDGAGHWRVLVHVAHPGAVGLLETLLGRILPEIGQEPTRLARYDVDWVTQVGAPAFAELGPECLRELERRIAGAFAAARGFARRLDLPEHHPDGTEPASEWPGVSIGVRRFMESDCDEIVIVGAPVAGAGGLGDAAPQGVGRPGVVVTGGARAL